MKRVWEKGMSGGARKGWKIGKRRKVWKLGEIGEKEDVMRKGMRDGRKRGS